MIEPSTSRPALLALVVSAAACAGAPPPAPIATAAPVQVGAAPPKPPAESLSPAAKVVMTGVLSHPTQSYAALAAMLRGTPLWDVFTTTLEALAGGVSGALDLHRPVLFAISADKRVAIGIDVAPGAEGKLAERFHLTAAPDGGFRPNGEGDADRSVPFSCTIPAVQGRPLQLVCANDVTSIASLAPALAHIKVDERGPDLHTEMTGRAMRDGFGPGDHNGRADDSMSKAEALGEQLGRDFGSDIDSALFDVALTDSALAKVAFRFGRDSSPFTHVLTAHPERAAVPTPAFWHLPVDSSVAVFSQGVEAEDLAGIRSIVFGLVDDSMKGDGCAEATAYLDERIHALFLTGGSMVVGFGNDMSLAEKAVASLRAQSKDTDAARARTRQALESWTLVEVDEPPSKWLGPMRELALADRRFPKCKSPAPEGDAPKPKDHTTVDVAPADGRLPKATLHIVARTTPTADALPDGAPAHTTHVFVVPDGGHTWFGIGENEAMVIARVKAALDGAPASGTLSARPGLESLRAPAAGGGFVTVEGISMLTIDDNTGEQMREADTTLTMLRSLPSKGKAPIPIYWRGTSNELGAHVLVPRAAIAELLALIHS